MGANTPENSLLLADMTDERRFSYTPHEFLDAHARLYANYFFTKWAFAGRNIPIPEEETRIVKYGLAHFSDALNYPTDQSLSDEMRSIGEAAWLTLKDELKGSEIDLTLPGMVWPVCEALGNRGLQLKISYDLIREGGIEDLRREMFA